MIDLRCALIAMLFAVVTTAAVAQERPGRNDGQQGGPGHEGQSSPGVLALLPSDAVTEHSIDLASGKLAYTATAGIVRPIG